MLSVANNSRELFLIHRYSVDVLEHVMLVLSSTFICVLVLSFSGLFVYSVHISHVRVLFVVLWVAKKNVWLSRQGYGPIPTVH